MHVDGNSLKQPISVQSIVKSVRSNLKVPKGFASEHIQIGGETKESAEEPTIVSKQFSLANIVRGLQLEFTLFNEGFLKVREHRRKSAARDYMLELKFLNPKPMVIKRFVTETFWVALGMLGVALVAWLLTALTDLDPYTVPTSIVFATGAIVALLLCTYQSGEKILFCTASGNIPVLIIIASFGSFHRSRKIVPEISNAIGRAISNNTLDVEPYLRAEMQDHYRLRNEGVISSKACNMGTARILSRFG
jgi:hypothetical protein